MNNGTNHNPNQNPSFLHNEGTENYRNQLVVIRDFLQNNTATRYMIAIKTGIPIQSVCYRVAALFESDRVAVVKIDHCQISGHNAEYLTTDPEQFPDNLQTKLNF